MNKNPRLEERVNVVTGASLYTVTAAAGSSVHFPQKSNKLHKSSLGEGHVACPGFFDQHSIWNNGFLCPRWTVTDSHHCCGSAEDRMCCPAQDQSGSGSDDLGTVASRLTSSWFAAALGVGAAVVLLVTFVVVLFCWFCPCCPVSRRRRCRSSDTQKTSPPITNLSRPESVNREARQFTTDLETQALYPVHCSFNYVSENIPHYMTLLSSTHQEVPPMVGGERRRESSTSNSDWLEAYEVGGRKIDVDTMGGERGPDVVQDILSELDYSYDGTSPSCALYVDENENRPVKSPSLSNSGRLSLRHTPRRIHRTYLPSDHLPASEPLARITSSSTTTSNYPAKNDDAVTRKSTPTMNSSYLADDHRNAVMTSTSPPAISHHLANDHVNEVKTSSPILSHCHPVMSHPATSRQPQASAGLTANQNTCAHTTDDSSDTVAILPLPPPMMTMMSPSVFRPGITGGCFPSLPSLPSPLLNHRNTGRQQQEQEEISTPNNSLRGYRNVEREEVEGWRRDETTGGQGPRRGYLQEKQGFDGEKGNTGEGRDPTGGLNSFGRHISGEGIYAGKGVAGKRGKEGERWEITSGMGSLRGRRRKGRGDAGNDATASVTLRRHKVLPSLDTSYSEPCFEFGDGRNGERGYGAGGGKEGKDGRRGQGSLAGERGGEGGHEQRGGRGGRERDDVGRRNDVGRGRAEMLSDWDNHEDRESCVWKVY